MNCEDLMNIPKIYSGMKLIAGGSGMYRNIRWIYFADCTQCLSDDFKVSQLIHGGELVIVTNAALTDNDDKMLSMIVEMNQKNIAGLVINVGQISPMLTEYCNDNELPLFELSYDLHLIDLSQIVCKALVEEESNTNSIDQLLAAIIYSSNINDADIKIRAGYLGTNISDKNHIVVLKLNKNNKLQDSYENLQRYIRYEFKNYGLQKMLMLWQIDTGIMLIPSELFSRDLLSNILTRIIDHINSYYGIDAKAGIGSAYEYISELKKSFQEALNSIKISHSESKSQKIFFYDNLGIYSLIAQIKNDKFLDEYVNNHIGKLIQSDVLQEGDLCKTLEAYLDHNCNAAAAAEHLFIHRNTMRYRMDKIKKILCCELDDLDVYLELKMAFEIKTIVKVKKISHNLLCAYTTIKIIKTTHCCYTVFFL